MSYRNPQIIVDRSAEIWAQGIAKVGDTIGAGITNYFKAKALAKQKKDKIDNANNKLLIQTQIKYDKDIVDQVGKVKSNVFKDLVDKNITAFGNKAMESNARLAISGVGLSREQAKEERDNVRNYNQYSANTIGQVNSVSENADSILKNPTDVIVSQYEPAYGDDLSNLVAVNVVNGNSIPGVTTNVAIEPTKDNSNILRINSRLKVDSDIYRSYKAAGIIDDELYPPTDGYIDIKFERNLSEWDGTFFDKIIDAPDSDKAFIEGGIRDKKGTIDPRYILKNMATTTVLNKDGSSTKYREQILDINAIENAQAYNSIVTSQAVGLGSYDIKQRKQYITGALNWTGDAANAYASKNPDEQQAFFEGQLKMENLSLLAKPRKVTQEDVDNKLIPDLKLLDDNGEPNFIYTIPYGDPVTVERKGDDGLTATQIKFKNKVDFASEVLDEVYSLAGKTKDRGNKEFTIDEQGAFLTILNEKRLATDEKIVNTEELKSQFINQYKADDFTQEDAEAAWEEQSPNTTLAYMKGRNIIGVDLSNPNNIRKTIIELLNPGIKSGEVDRILKATNNFKSKNPLLNN